MNPRAPVRPWPEIGDLGYPAIVVKIEEAQAGLRALWPGELDPAGGLQALADDPLHRDVPVIAESLHVEPDVGFPAADLLLGLGAAVDHIVGEQCAERIPVPSLRRGPVGRDHLMRAGHAGQSTRAAGHRGLWWSWPGRGLQPEGTFRGCSSVPHRGA